MPSDILPSPELIDRTLQIENAYSISRMQVLESLPGNPVGIAFRQIGGAAVGMMAKHFPNPNFNKITGLGAGQEGGVEGLVAWCRDNGVTPRFEILPRGSDRGLCQELARLAAAAAHWCCDCRWRRLHLQRGGVPVRQPSQHGARRHARAVRPFNLDGARDLNAVLRKLHAEFTKADEAVEDPLIKLG